MWVYKIDIKSINTKSEESSPNEFSQEWWSSLYCLSGRNIYSDLSIASTLTGYHLSINHRWESWSKKSYGYIEEHQQLHNLMLLVLWLLQWGLWLLQVHLTNTTWPEIYGGHSQHEVQRSADHSLWTLERNRLSKDNGLGNTCSCCERLLYVKMCYICLRSTMLL